LNQTALAFVREDRWPISWITLADVGVPPFVLGFRLIFEQMDKAIVHFYITADERYELYLDGALVSRGPERGSPEAWYYTTLDLDISEGSHVLFARVWALGDKAPFAQFTVCPGFLLGVEKASDGAADAKWSTGLAPWEVKRLDGYDWIDHPDIGFDGFTGKKLRFDGNRYPWGVERGEGDGWAKAVINARACISRPTDLSPIRLLVPGTLPPMLQRPVPAAKVRFVEEVPREDDMSGRRVDSQHHRPDLADKIQALLEKRSTLGVPARTRYRAVIDLENYFCAYPRIDTCRGKDAKLTLRWAEALFQMPEKNKGQRDGIEGRLFRGFADQFILDGEANRSYTTLWWEAGRYLELVIETAEEELQIDRLILEETRYPLEEESTCFLSDGRWEKLKPMLLRSIQVNAHETFMDCPYYEQLSYAGDTLFDCLALYAITSDVRLARKSLHLYDISRTPDGLTQSRFPCRVRQYIPPFSLLWISMVRHHAWWRGEPEFIRTLLPGVRAVIDAHLPHTHEDGLLKSLPGWNFLDWMNGWEAGVPPGGDPGDRSGPLNWLFVYALQAAVELETYAGEPELVARYSRLARDHALAAEAAFWDEERGLFADDLDHRHFSEHSQCLAILSGRARDFFIARAGKELLEAKDLKRCAFYFSHYFFETCHRLNQAEPLFQRLEDWHRLPSQGFVTTPETSEPSRSDCHAWGGHPLFHLYATILGIRPASMGFSTVEIRPQLGHLQKAAARMVHPQGWIEADLRQIGSKIEGIVSLPEKVTGIFYGSVAVQVLVPGNQFVSA
jgi:alpha-L-rhamnosidase